MLRHPVALEVQQIADKLNAGNMAHAEVVRSYKQAWAAELSGVVDHCADTAVEILSDIGESKGHAPLSRGSDDWNSARNMCANLLFHGLKAKPELRQKIPTLYIEACLHASIRWDKSRRLVGNDLYDFNHASAAVAHCQAFFTEAPLKALLTSNHHGLKDEFDCRVAADVGEALSILRDFLATGRDGK